MEEVRSSYEQLHRDVEAMCHWLESLSIGIAKNRVAEYRKTFATIARYQGRWEDLEDSIGFEKLSDNYYDCSELVLIWQKLKDCGSPPFKNTPRQAVNGPTTLEAERPETSDARNRIFELVMAALFRAANFPIKFVEPADAVVNAFNVKCFLECKRIQSEKRLEERIREASSQIEDRLGKQPSKKSRGLIAVDISKAENDGTVYCNATSSDHLSRQVDTILDCFITRNKRKLISRLSPRVLATIVYIRIPAVIEDAALLANFRRAFLLSNPIIDDRDERICKHLLTQFSHQGPKGIFK